MILKEIEIPEFKFGDVDRVLKDLFLEGYHVTAMRLNAFGIMHMVHMAEDAGMILRTAQLPGVDVAVGAHVQGYVDPISGVVIPIDYDRFAPLWRIQFEGYQHPGAENQQPWECGCTRKM